MPSLKIHERFTLDAPPERVWSYLTDASRVVVCLPGAVLERSSEDGRTHEGAVKIKVGSVTVAYKGRAEFVEVDDEALRMRMEARGRERTGSGSVSMTMVSTVHAVDGGTEVVVEADVQLAGKIVMFGRGMIDVVSRELFKDFTRCLAERVGSEDPSPGDEDPPAEGATAGEPEGTLPDGEAAGPGRSDPVPPTDASAGADGTAGGAPLDGISFLFRVLRAMVGRLFGRS